MSGLAHLARAQVAKLPEVTAMIVTDRAGSLLEVSGDVDGEALGAVYAVTADAFVRMGQQLGIGALARIAITGRTTACVVVVDDEGIVTAKVDPSKPMNGIEKKLESALRR